MIWTFHHLKWIIGVEDVQLSRRDIRLQARSNRCHIPSVPFCDSSYRQTHGQGPRSLKIGKQLLSVQIDNTLFVLRNNKTALGILLVSEEIMTNNLFHSFLCVEGFNRVDTDPINDYISEWAVYSSEHTTGIALKEVTWSSFVYVQMGTSQLLWGGCF